MKHLYPKWDEEKKVWVKGPTNHGPKRKPRKDLRCKCHLCDEWFFSRKAKATHTRLSHPKVERVLFTEDGLPVKAAA